MIIMSDMSNSTNNPFSSVTRCLHHWRKNSEGSLSVLHNSPILGLHARLLGFYYTIITVTLDLSAQRHTQTVISSQNSTVHLSFSALPTHFIQLIHDTNLNVQSPHKCSGLSKRHTNSMSLRQVKTTRWVQFASTYTRLSGSQHLGSKHKCLCFH